MKEMNLNATLALYLGGLKVPNLPHFREKDLTILPYVRDLIYQAKRDLSLHMYSLNET